MMHHSDYHNYDGNKRIKNPKKTNKKKIKQELQRFVDLNGDQYNEPEFESREKSKKYSTYL